MSSSTTAITLRFLGQGASATATSTDAVVLTVSAGKEEYVMEQLAAAISNGRAGMTVIADDQNSTYFLPEITAVSSISVDSDMVNTSSRLTTTYHHLLFFNHGSILYPTTPILPLISFTMIG